MLEKLKRGVRRWNTRSGKGWRHQEEGRQPYRGMQIPLIYLHWHPWILDEAGWLRPWPLWFTGKCTHCNETGGAAGASLSPCPPPSPPLLSSLFFYVQTGVYSLSADKVLINFSDCFSFQRVYFAITFSSLRFILLLITFIGP